MDSANVRSVILTIILIAVSCFAILLTAGAVEGAWSLAVGRVPRCNRQGLKVAVATAFCFALANIVAELALTLWVGGEAFRGRIEGDAYFVASHGHLTQVSAIIWHLKHWHELLTLFSLPLLLPGLIWVVWLELQERLFSRANAQRAAMPTRTPPKADLPAD